MIKRATLALVVPIAILLVACGGGADVPPASPSPVAGPPQTSLPTPTISQTASPTPQVTITPSLTPYQPQWTIFQLSQEGEAQVVVEDGLNAYTLASLDPELAQFERWDIAFIADTNGDGSQDAIVRRYSGGAHCCFDFFFLGSEPGGIRLFDSFTLGNATIGALQDLDGDSIPELRAFDDRLAYFADLPYAGSPFLPLVLCRSVMEVYYDCTPQFPEALLDSAQQFEEHLKEAVHREAGEEERRSAALGLVASYLRLEMGEEGWSRVAALCPECESWLRQNVGELQDRIGAVAPYRIPQ